ncbi:hypothetical protein PA905_42770 [Planktothrix agardhii CCAP 1459/11A]|jgi:uncharacterized protein (DUF1499 family)|uniref:DUF1499 domain-containing protein n=1 Tax=Planktothrix agardhii CCAP 1459/11A TaxID=282420 RepID=A0A4P5ZI73_PLAAG|nr:DUF1499 domain-containing protein [Planktothrix agardhii]GDZ95846.1 hypothetical protein PA905_42770 [Planktothrix agardhii CCAP 1459/11A]CAD5950976.1 hypothetical protein NO108_02923 [Planktothrix rubescens]CAH2570885.1 hypothetical protein PRNO82_00274 [Planktothrix rubescens]
MKKSVLSIGQIPGFSILLTTIIFVSSLLGLVPSALANTTPVSPIIASIFSFSGNRPTNLGIEQGKFAPCPTSPNCVSSQSLDTQHQIEPFNYQDTPKKAFENLKIILANTENAEIITAEANYIYAEFTSDLMGFVDDVEFYLDEKDSLIQVRSASRLGESDLGANRKRIEAIRARFQL